MTTKPEILAITARALQSAERELLVVTVALAQIRDLANVALKVDLPPEGAAVIFRVISKSADDAIRQALYEGVNLNVEH